MFICSLFIAFSISTNASAVNKKSCVADSTAAPDWVAQTDQANLCQGYYQPYVPTDINYQRDDLDLPIDIDFDSSQTVLNGTSSFFNAFAQQGQRTLKSDQLDIQRVDGNWESLQAKGHVEFHQPNISIWADDAFYEHSTQYFKLNCSDLRWYPRHARANSRTTELLSNQNLVLHDAVFTTCPPGNTDWSLHADKITLIPDTGRAKAKHLSLRAAGMPVFYWPYLEYPIDNKRHSGFLFPSYGNSSQSGMEITVPYYFNLAPNYDFTLSLSGYSKRGAGLASRFRYINTNLSTTLDLQYLPDDRAYQKFRMGTLAQIPSGYSITDPRIQGIGHHNYRFGTVLKQHVTLDKWQFNIDYHYVSDDNFFVDLGNDIHTISTIHLPQRVNAFYYGHNWSHTFKVEEYQVLQAFKGDIVNEIYRRQPQWLFGADYPNILGPLNFKLNGEMVNFTHPGNPTVQTTQVQGQRGHIQPSFNLPLRRSWGEVIPTFYADWLGYSLDQKHTPTQTDNHPNRFSPIYTLDSRIFFEKNYNKHSCAWTQTLIPRLYYTYIPYRDQSQYPNFDSGVINFSYAQLYRHNRFSGGDRLNEANQLSLSLNTQLLNSDNLFEWFRMGVGEIFYFTPEKVRLCDPSAYPGQCGSRELPRQSVKHSNILSEFVFSSPSKLQAGSFVEWSTNGPLIEQASLFLHYPFLDQYLFNLNYYFTRHDEKNLNLSTATLGRLSQGDASILMPLTQKINVLGRVHYDFEFNQFIETLGGLEYNSCCFAWQIVFSRYRQLGNALVGREFVNQFMFQVVFKGLSSVGLNQADGKLDRKIPGYTPLADRVALPKVG
tara:strand:+ start:4719 stop:7199 length:2481 start_codon:yes stop_codon:yes gene_type:complete